MSIPAQAATSLSSAFPTTASTSTSTVVVRRLLPTDSHAIPISPCYQQTLQQLELQQIELAEHVVTQQSDTVNANKTIFVYWWPEVCGFTQSAPLSAVCNC